MERMRKHLRRLENLTQLDVDAIGTYDASIPHIHDEAIAARLREFRADHQRHVLELNNLIEKLGGEPVESKPDLKGIALSGFTKATSVLGTEAALMAMVGNEELTTHTYEWALKVDWDDEARSLIAKNYDDERRHLEFIKQTLKGRIWERRGEQHA